MASFLDRLRGRPEPSRPRAEKAVTSLGGWANAIPLSSTAATPQQRAATYLRAYKVGWFYKAGKKVADDVSALDWSVSLGDSEEGDEQNTLDRPDLRAPFDSLSPIDQFQRLLERPNPSYTGRSLLRKTQVRLDFAGAAAWYLEGATSGLPTALYGISPARLWPSYDRQGELIGWVMDKDSTNPVPFDTSEILWFTTGNADDDDIWGTSVVEAVYSQVPLTDLMARHTANVLTTGGRLAGMMWPKERSLGEDEYQDALRAWRNVSSDPDAGKRLLIFPEPMEYAAGASTPAEIGIPELATLNRDEILTAFPVSPYRLGVPMPGGLNSGEIRREDRRDYWEETIHPRADLIEETIQVGLLSLYEEAMGQTLDFEIEEPNLDDATTLIGKADAFKALVGIGSDPDESIKAVGLGHIKWLGLPAILDPVQQQMMREQQVQALSAQAQESPQPEPPRPMPATRSLKVQAEDDRDRILGRVVPFAQRELDEFFRDQRDRVTSALREQLPASKSARRTFVKADPPWWDGEFEDRELQRVVRSIYVAVGRESLQVAADALGRVIYRGTVEPIVEDLLTRGGSRIKDINDRTLQSLVTELAEGTRRGYSVPQLIEGVPDEGYRGVMGVTLDNGAPVFGDARAEVIARTETMLSYNRASVRGYEALGVERFIAYDGDEDLVCAERNGETFSADEAADIEDHPNGTLVFSPLLVEKSYHPEPRSDAVVVIKADNVTVPPPELPAIPAPVVNVAPAEVTVDLSGVTDLLADIKEGQKAMTAKVTDLKSGPPIVVTPTVQDVRIVASTVPPRKRLVKRDFAGRITELAEE